MSDSDSDDYINELLGSSAKEEITAIKKENPDHEYIRRYTEWYLEHIGSPNTIAIYQKFSEAFREEKINIFEAIRTCFRDEEIVSDAVLYCWKGLIYDLLRNNKKYPNYTNSINYDSVNRTINLMIGVKGPHFYITVPVPESDDRQIIYIKDNGCDIYLG